MTKQLDRPFFTEETEGGTVVSGDSRRLGFGDEQPDEWLVTGRTPNCPVRAPESRRSRVSKELQRVPVFVNVKGDHTPVQRSSYFKLSARVSLLRDESAVSWEAGTGESLATCRSPGECCVVEVGVCSVEVGVCSVERVLAVGREGSVDGTGRANEFVGDDRVDVAL